MKIQMDSIVLGTSKLFARDPPRIRGFEDLIVYRLHNKPFCQLSTMAIPGRTTRILKTVVFMGSARNVIPPWGGDARLGDRVLKYVINTLKDRQQPLGNVTVQHDVSIVDPVVVFGENGALSEISAGELTNLTFFMKQLPPKAQALKDLISAADCYVIVSPEYNHVVPPALASVMGHFGGSCYKAKPSAILTYSAGPWGGQRAAVSILAMAHELGCLPVSKMAGLPAVSELLNSDGSPVDPSHRMLRQLPEMLNQLEWLAVAMKNQRDLTGSF
jgi:chromate reductase, NAD(P)H dehydrogenase (quinone)